jgi:plastocyanin
MIEQAWSALLDFASKFVIPDWGSVIALLPVVLAVVVVLFLARMVYVYATIGPARVRSPRSQPVPPAGVHMPGPSWAPFIGAFGTFMLFLGLVFGGFWAVVGLVALVLALLVWLREGLRDYDHVADAHPAPVAVPVGSPPPGVHMPGPSFRPFLVSLGIFLLFLGLVFGGWLLLVGLVFTIVTLLGWLNDARKEYRHVVDADRTGHIENEPAPTWPKKLLWTVAIVVFFAVILNLGILPPKSTAGEGEAGGSPAPSGGEAGGPSGAPAPPGEIKITAQNVKFDVSKVSSPAGAPFKIVFDNKDAGTPHDVDILDADGKKVFDGKDFPGPKVETYDVPALDAGTYKFECSIHPALMNGELVAGP